MIKMHDLGRKGKVILYRFNMTKSHLYYVSKSFNKGPVSRAGLWRTHTRIEDDPIVSGLVKFYNNVIENASLSL